MECWEDSWVEGSTTDEKCVYGDIHIKDVSILAPKYFISKVSKEIYCL